MDDHFSTLNMLKQGWVILSILTVCSVLAWTITIERYFVLRRIRKSRPCEFLSDLTAVVRTQGVNGALRTCDATPGPAATVAAAVLRQEGHRDERDRALQRSLQDQIRRMQAHVPILGTVGSMAPFIGLLGTVIGIVKAFRDISTHVGGGPEVVSAGIAEALVTTAAGLIVAIPAVMAYNYFVHQVQEIAGEIDSGTFDLIEAVEKAGR